MMRLAAKLLLLLSLGLAGCATSPPRNPDNLCQIFEEKRGWYKESARAAKRWDSDVAIVMSIMHQESRFRAKAKPPRRKILWVIPGFRASNAYGYSQAKKETWRWYVRSADAWGADRDDFGDSADFIAWYNRQSTKMAGIPRNDAYRLYLAYHEGHGGYRAGSYRNKAWLTSIASQVQRRAASYRNQLAQCEARLKKQGWWIFG